MDTMDWIRDNIKAIGAVVVLAMLMPFILVMTGLIRF